MPNELLSVLSFEGITVGGLLLAAIFIVYGMSKKERSNADKAQEALLKTVRDSHEESKNLLKEDIAKRDAHIESLSEQLSDEREAHIMRTENLANGFKKTMDDFRLTMDDVKRNIKEQTESLRKVTQKVDSLQDAVENLQRKGD